MECLYAPDLTPESRLVTLSGDELAHLRALRLREGERVLLSNGAGLCAECVVELVEKRVADRVADRTVECVVLRQLPLHNEPHAPLHLGLGVLDSRERMEFAIEKCTELGLRSFAPILADRSQHHRVNTERLQAKALAAMKQSQRSHLPHVCSPQSLQTVLEGVGDAMVVLADVDGAEPQKLPESVKTHGVWVFVGPEGGFSERELLWMKEREESGLLLRWNLGRSRLRAETAAVLALGVAAMNVPA
jgi:16S rRNA (uracil1498-N3)-methyltransferase